MAFASTSAATYAPSQHLESWGTHCHESTCNLADFLPFVCPHCHQPYCSAHRTPTSHSCTSYDASAYDRRAASCILCGQVLPNGSSNADDIDALMDRHLESGKCTAYNAQNGLFTEDVNAGKKKERGLHQCRYGRCEGRNWADIKCGSCGKGFCPSHRDPKHHKCTALGGHGTPSPRAPPIPPSARPKDPIVSVNLSSQAVTSKSGLQRFGLPKPSMTPTILSNPTKVSVSAASSAAAAANSKPQNPTRPPITEFVNLKLEDKKVSKRAARERESAALALKKRAEKGLLSEDEKVRYATLQALEAKSGRSGAGSNKDCCIA